MSSKPNILWFVADRMRCDSMAHMGNPAASTPNLDTLTEECGRGRQCSQPYNGGGSGGKERQL